MTTTMIVIKPSGLHLMILVFVLNIAAINNNNNTMVHICVKKAKVEPLACERTSLQTCSSCTTTSCSRSGAGLCKNIIINAMIITIILMKY